MPEETRNRPDPDQKDDCPGGEQEAEETEQQPHERSNLTDASRLRCPSSLFCR
jgi:hypothetical protein